MREAHDLALAVQDKTDKYKKEYYDLHHVDVEYEIGDLVWLYTPRLKPGLSKKLSRKNTGPFEIVRKHSPVLYTLRSAQGNEQRAHIQRLIPCYIMPGARWEKFGFPQNHSANNPDSDESRVVELDSVSNASNDSEFTFDSTCAILRSRVSFDTNETEFLVRKGNEQVWIPQDQIPVEFGEEIQKFKANSRKKRASRR